MLRDTPGLLGQLTPKARPKTHRMNSVWEDLQVSKAKIVSTIRAVHNPRESKPGAFLTTALSGTGRESGSSTSGFLRIQCHTGSEKLRISNKSSAVSLTNRIKVMEERISSPDHMV